MQAHWHFLHPHCPGLSIFLNENSEVGKDSGVKYADQKKRNHT